MAAKNQETFEPEIIAFCCLYCAYTAADTAGKKGEQYPANVKIVRVPCSSKVDAQHILSSFEKGADGVMVAGCLEGECHFDSGNKKAAARVEHTKTFLEEIGIESERLSMVNLSAGMGEEFAAKAVAITENIRTLGPNPVGAKKAKAA